VEVDTLDLTIGEALPRGDDLARWLVTLGLVLGDLQSATTTAGRAANDAECVYFSRLSWAHFREAIRAVSLVDRPGPIATFFEGLSPLTRGRANKARGIYNAEARLIDELRHQVFHYPSPDGLQSDGWARLDDVIGARAAMPITYERGGVLESRILFMDELAATRFALAIEPSHDPDALQRTFARLSGRMATGVTELVLFVNEALTARLAQVLTAAGKSCEPIRREEVDEIEPQWRPDRAG
jgi:hypothetical protein